MDEAVAWSAEHQPTAHTIAARYRNADRDVQLFVVLFPQQRQGGEAITNDNQISTELVRQTDLGRQHVTLGQEKVKVNRHKAVIAVAKGPQEYLVWQWYRVAGRSLSNRYKGKAWEALARIYPGRADGAWIAITTPFEQQSAQVAEEALASFARSAVPRIDAAIDAAIGFTD
jgi:EpsI family protein